MHSTANFYVLVHALPPMPSAFIYCGLITINLSQELLTLMFLWDAYLAKEGGSNPHQTERATIMHRADTFYMALGQLEV